MSPRSSALSSASQAAWSCGEGISPGGGAEIFAARVLSIICDHKIDGSEWLETARLAHKLGFRIVP